MTQNLREPDAIGRLVGLFWGVVFGSTIWLLLIVAFLMWWPDQLRAVFAWLFVCVMAGGMLGVIWPRSIMWLGIAASYLWWLIPF